jgi:hypothetical protein
MVSRREAYGRAGGAVRASAGAGRASGAGAASIANAKWAMLPAPWSGAGGAS